MDRERWASLKDLIRHLYIEQNLNCKEVATILREQHDDRVRERTLQRHMKEWGFVKGSHLEYLPQTVSWQSQELADLIEKKFWESKTDSQIFKELAAEGHTNISQRQVRSIRGRKGLLRISKLKPQAVIDYLNSEPPPFESLPSIRRLVKNFREEKHIWVTRDICNDALNMTKGKEGRFADSSQPQNSLPTAAFPVQ